MIKNYKLFTTPSCPNCYDIKEFMRNIKIKGDFIDAATDIGLKEADKYEISSVPTVLFFDENDKLISVAHNLEEIKRAIENKTLINLNEQLKKVVKNDKI